MARQTTSARRRFDGSWSVGSLGTWPPRTKEHWVRVVLIVALTVVLVGVLVWATVIR